MSVPCEPGTFSDKEGVKQCEKAAAGSYVAEKGATADVKCA